MADLNSMILRIRRRIHDALFEPAETRPLYSDTIYSDCINRGITRLNFALNKDYTIATLPARAEYLAELRATIEMCRIRGAEGTTGDIDDKPDLAAQQVVLPGGFSQMNQQMQYEGPKYWRSLAADLEKEYHDALDDYLSNIEGDGAIVVGVIQRKSLRTGRATMYAYDRPLTAPDISTSVSGNNVAISWEPILSEFLELYEIHRSSDVGFSSFDVVYTTWDNQTKLHIDTGLAAGTYYYRLNAENTNGMESYSQSSQVVIA